jgi:molybdopterin synthase sulfur carrier subunit
MKVFVPTHLQSYTGGAREIEIEGTSLAELMDNMNRRYPGFRFRIINEQDTIRPHIRIFVNQEQARSLAETTKQTDTIHIVCALSGG